MSAPQPASPAEITLKAVIIALLITVILAASNIYLALKVGTTIAASIPAAVLAMGVLRFFRHSNIFEINIIQTAASAGEGMAAALSFVLPALLMLGYWHHFHYWETVGLSLIGGVLGVLFSIPLRRIMLNYPTLRFPEGTAIGNVLKASASQQSYTRQLAQGGLAGGLIALAQTGFKVLSDTFPLWTVSGQSLFGISLGFSPAMLGAGYIVGIEVGLSLLLGVVLIWVFGMPILTHIYGLPPADSTYDMAMTIWSQHIRYIGVGTMLLGGIWTLLTLIKPIIQGIKVSFTSATQLGRLEEGATRAERDLPMRYALWGALVFLVLGFMVFVHTIGTAQASFTPGTVYGLSLFATFYILVVGFIMACICGYFTGLIGSTNNPLSGLLIISVLLCSVFVLPIYWLQTHQMGGLTQAAAIIIVIIITSVIAAVASISNENLQDLKAGQMIGATPWKQQIMLAVGVVVSSFVVAPVLELLFNAYGMGGVFPRPGMNPSQMLGAPQAGLMAMVARGVFEQTLRWGEIGTGALIAVLGIVLDEAAKRKGHRVPILAIGLGIYLPPETMLPIIGGGVVSFLVNRHLDRRRQLARNEQERLAVDERSQRGMLLACGLVAGAALMGVFLAIPFVLAGNAEVLSLVPASYMPIANVLGLVVTLIVYVWMYRVPCQPTKNKGTLL